MLRVAPAIAFLIEDRGGGLLEGGHGTGATTGGERVAAGTGELAVRERRLARLGERDEREAAEPERAGLAADDDPLHPAAGAGRVNLEVQTVAVAVAAGLGDATAEGGAQGLVGVAAATLGGAGLLRVGGHGLSLFLPVSTSRPSHHALLVHDAVDHLARQFSSPDIACCRSDTGRQENDPGWVRSLERNSTLDSRRSKPCPPDPKAGNADLERVARE